VNADPAAAGRGLDRLRELAARRADGDLGGRLAVVLEDDAVASLLGGLFAGSPYLTECLLAEPDLLPDLAAAGPDVLLGRELDAARAVDGSERTRLMAGLRRAKRRLALLTGLADLQGLWTLEQVCAALTAFADLAVQKALDHLLVEGAKRGELELVDPAAPAVGSGAFVIGMGKHGAGELNYSSDIDLILLFDDEVMRTGPREGPMAVSVRIARALGYLLEQKTRDGYVFRTDFRLRPHLPGHPLALSTDAAELYYERHGQNWERASFIKARVVAGDMAAGELFLRRLQPFIWRRHLDYAAIRDIHSIKRQINAHRGFGSIRIRGHDLKVGRGGIREIEFFTQTQQLILGGRVPELRSPRTVEALAALAAGRWVDERAAAELILTYRFLRAVEHRLQMVADRQTQQLPDRDVEFQRFTAFAGFASTETFSTVLRGHLERVERHYAALFEREADLGAGGSLVFTGTSDDPDTLQTLSRMGFKDPSAISARIRSWHHGHIRATRSTRARELLTELLPSILKSLERHADIDAAFRRFDEFVSGLPAGVQLFSLFHANPRLLTLISDLMGAAPRLAQHLSSNVDLFDAMLAPDFFEPLPAAATLERELGAKLRDARDLQDELDICRRWAHGRQFQAGLQVLLALAPAERAAATLTSVAEIVIATLLPRAEAWLVAQHGRIAGGSFVVLGLGKLGSRELTVGSDLDLVFIYDAPEEAVSTSDRPLPATTWYARLGQRLVSALTARTAEGRLFEIDMRLRPSGNVGPVACSARNFEDYQAHTAQTWEQQALTRARVVAGDAALAARVSRMIDAAVARPRDPWRLARDVRAMRERIFREHGSDEVWNVKHCRGGLVELEFIAQFLQLRHAHTSPEIRSTATAEVVRRAAALGLLPARQAHLLTEALHLYQALQAVLRLSLTDRLKPAEAPKGLLEALVRVAAGDPQAPVSPLDFAALEERLVATEAAVRQIFDELCPPAADAGAGEAREGTP
jgi:glutamate-ammonia-ligase adenylyltransferase